MYQHFHFVAVFRGCCHLCTRSISHVLLFSVRRLPFLSSMFDDRRLTFFGEGFQDGISLSGVVSLHASVYFSAPFVYPVVLCFSHSFSAVFI